VALKIPYPKMPNTQFSNVRKRSLTDGSDS
jgi:hypothetical protein